MSYVDTSGLETSELGIEAAKELTDGGDTAAVVINVGAHESADMTAEVVAENRRARERGEGGPLYGPALIVYRVGRGAIVEESNGVDYERYYALPSRCVPLLLARLVVEESARWDLLEEETDLSKNLREEFDHFVDNPDELAVC